MMGIRQAVDFSGGVIEDSCLDWDINLELIT